MQQKYHGTFGENGTFSSSNNPYDPSGARKIETMNIVNDVQQLKGVDGL